MKMSVRVNQASICNERAGIHVAKFGSQKVAGAKWLLGNVRISTVAGWRLSHVNSKLETPTSTGYIHLILSPRFDVNAI